jgi:hypothetical protein
MAPVKAPLSCPKSSLSRRVSGMAPQWTATKGPALLLLRSWIRRAISPLPVPVSPVRSTVVRVGATARIFARTGVIASLEASGIAS